MFSEKKTRSSSLGVQSLDGKCGDDENAKEVGFSGSQPSDMAMAHSYSDGIVMEDMVVKKWQDASARVTVQPVRELGLPLIFWLMSSVHSDSSVVDIFSEDITLAQVLNPGRRCYYTKGGWLLFRQHGGRPSVARFFLQHVSSGVRIDLPDMKGFKLGNAVFTTFSSSPEYVVNVNCGFHRNLSTIHVIRLGDEQWIEYSTSHVSWKPFYTAVVIKESKVYCFDHSAEIVIFDLIDRQWVPVAVEPEHYSYCVVEFDDEIVKMQPLRPDFKSYRFYKLQIHWEEAKAAWVEMSGEEWKGRSFFVDMNGAFSVKTEREVLYRFRAQNLGMVSEGKLVNGVEAFDLIEGAGRSCLPFAFVSPVHPVWTNLAN